MQAAGELARVLNIGERTMIEKNVCLNIIKGLKGGKASPSEIRREQFKKFF